MQQVLPLNKKSTWLHLKVFPGLKIKFFQQVLGLTQLLFPRECAIKKPAMIRDQGASLPDARNSSVNYFWWGKVLLLPSLFLRLSSDTLFASLVLFFQSDSNCVMINQSGLLSGSTLLSPQQSRTVHSWFAVAPLSIYSINIHKHDTKFLQWFLTWVSRHNKMQSSSLLRSFLFWSNTLWQNGSLHNFNQENDIRYKKVNSRIYIVASENALIYKFIL